MKKHNLKDLNTRRHHIIRQATTLSDLSFDDLYEDISDHWREKARRLQARRWRKIKNQTA